MTKDDLVIVGVSSAEGLLALGMSDLRNCRLLYRPGKDGADLALQDVMMTSDWRTAFPRSM